MKVSYHPSTERGVSQLMYVGDDGLPSDDPRTFLSIGLCAGYGLAKTRGLLRLGIAGAALYLMFGKRFPVA